MEVRRVRLLIAVRHPVVSCSANPGHTTKVEQITQRGFDLLEEKAPVIAGLIDQEWTAYGVSSPATRCVSALVYLQQKMDIPFQGINTSPLLFGEDIQAWVEIIDWLDAMADSEQAVIMSHYELLKALPAYCSQKWLIDIPDLVGDQLGPVCGLWVDFYEKSFGYI